MALRSFLLILCLINSGCSHLAHDRWTGTDKTQHFISSALFSSLAAAYAEKQHVSHSQQRTISLSFSIGLGAAKELYDSREEGTGWSWKDFVWDISGAMVGYGLYEAIKH